MKIIIFDRHVSKFNAEHSCDSQIKHKASLMKKVLNSNLEKYFIVVGSEKSRYYSLTCIPICTERVTVKLGLQVSKRFVFPS